MSTKVPATVVPYPPVPGTPLGVGTFFPSHAYANSTLLTGLVSYWKLDEVSGTRSDSVGTNHLTDNNTVTYVAGKNGNAAEFVAANSESLTKASHVLPDEFSISYWVKPTQIAVAQTFISSITAWPNSVQAHIYTGGGQAYTTAHCGDGTTYSTVVGDVGDLAIGVWTHVIVTYTASDKKVRLYHNNVTEKASTALPGTPHRTASTLTLGSAGSPVMDEVGIWSRVITSAERTTLYNAGAGKFYPSF